MRFDPGEEKKTVRLLDASYKAGELLEWYSTLRSDPLISPVLRNGTWTRLAPHTGLDATTWDLLERAFRREAVYPDPELQLWTTQTDSTGAKLEAGNAYRVVLTEPRVREGGLWTLSLRTGDNEIVDMITSSTVKKDFTDGMIKISVGRGADAVNLLETPDAGDLVLVLEIFGADGGFEGTVDKL